MTNSEQMKEFEEFYFEHFPKMVRLSTFMLCSQLHAEEVVQESFLKLHDRWDEAETPAALLRKIVVNKCTDVMRRRSVKDRYLKSVKHEIQIGKSDSSLEQNSTEGQYLIGLLTQLKSKRRQVIVLKFYGGFTLAEIAELMDIPEGTARSHLRRGLSKLKELADD